MSSPAEDTGSTPSAKDPTHAEKAVEDTTDEDQKNEEKKSKEKKKKQRIPGWPFPEMDETTMEQELLVTELLNRVVKNPPEDQPPLPQSLLAASEIDLRIASYKFLTARKWKVDDAEKMWRATIAFKKEQRTEEIAYFPPAFAVRGWDFTELNEFLQLPQREASQFDVTQRAIAHTYEACFHKWDKLNHPVFVERTGRVRVKHVVKAFKSLAAIGETPVDVCLPYHIYINEIGARLAKYNDENRGKPAGRRVLAIVVIIDCTGLGYHTLYNPAMQILKYNWESDQEYYPEGLHRVFVVNTPTMINFAWSIVKSWLDPRVCSKIQFVKPDKTGETLLEAIDPENLPEFLGGRCTCEGFGGCIDAMEQAEGTPQLHDEGLLTDEITVGAGKSETREFVLQVGEQAAWEWEVMDMNLEFSVKYTPHDGTDPEDIVSLEKGNHGSGSYTVQTANGRLVLVWSNHYSWLRSKALRLRCFKMESTAKPSAAGGAEESKEPTATPPQDAAAEKEETRNEGT